MEISQDKLRQIVIRVLSKYQKLNSAAPETEVLPVDRAGAYVLCEEGSEEAFLSFLRENKASGKLDVIAVLETPTGDLVRILLEEGLCSSIASPKAKSDGKAGLTVYPTFKRSALCEAALGMDCSFASEFLRRDFEEGRKSFVLMKGLDPFTGKEPEHYKKKIIGYIRELALMSVCFVRSAQDICCADEKKPEALDLSASKPETESSYYTLKTENNIVSARDLKQFPVGSRIYFADKKIITPLAKDVIRDRKLTIIGA